MKLEDVGYAFSEFGPDTIEENGQVYKRMRGLPTVFVEWFHDGGLNRRKAQFLRFEPLAGTATFWKLDVDKPWTLETRDITSIVRA